MCQIDWDALLQTIAAIISCIIAIMTYLLYKKVETQQKEIKELVDITSALKESNGILTKRFELENILSLKHRAPYFTRHESVVQGDIDKGTHVLHLTNAGTTAFNITFHRTEEDSQVYDISVFQEKAIRGDMIKVIVMFINPELRNSYNFSLSYENDENIEMYQRIIQHDIHRNQFRIYPPEVMPDFIEE